MEDLNADNIINDPGFVTLSQLLVEQPTSGPLDFLLSDRNLGSLPSTSSASPSANPSTTPAIPPKQSGRFSREAIRVLKAWLNTHVNKPYPRPDDVQFLQQQTGLDSKQITTWFANARRRGHIRDGRPQFSQTYNRRTDPVDIIARPGTPAVQLESQHTDPLQRWVESPPEHEAASFGDIVRAVATGSGQLSGMISTGSVCALQLTFAQMMTGMQGHFIRPPPQVVPAHPTLTRDPIATHLDPKDPMRRFESRADGVSRKATALREPLVRLIYHSSAPFALRLSRPSTTGNAMKRPCISHWSNGRVLRTALRSRFQMGPESCVACFAVSFLPMKRIWRHTNMLLAKLEARVSAVSIEKIILCSI